MGLLTKISAGDALSRYQAVSFSMLTGFLRCFTELIPLLVVVSVITLDKGSWDIAFVKSSDFALTMVFFQVASLIEIGGHAASKMDEDIVTFLKYVCVFFAIVFTVIYVFAYKHLQINVPDSVVIGFSIFSITIGWVLKCKYGYRKYFEEKLSNDNQSTEIRVK